MKPQSYKNHIRFYAPHHFVYYPLLSILLVTSIYIGREAKDPLIWTFFSIVFLILILLSFLLRQHYALTLQDRIVNLEVSFRYFSLTGKRLEDLQPPLRDKQIFALRFASDAEFLVLLEKTKSENWSGTKIKKEIQNWKSDNQRV
jgi:hypothetical protein